MGTLKDSLPLLPVNEFNPEIPPWVTEKFEKPKGEVASQSLDVPLELELKVTPTRARASDITSLQAQKFGDLIKKGHKPGAAAHMLRTTLKAIMDKPQFQKVAKDLVETYTITAEARRLMARALVNKGLAENSLPEGDAKLLVDYIKLANADTELGITQPTSLNVHVGIDPALKDLLDKTEPLFELGPAVDAETEDIPNK